jgi:hypothetical protein
LVEAVRTAPFVVVVGSSGAGKSSALRAGLLKAIESRQLDGVRDATLITPGAAPMRSIYHVPRSSGVVIVDQFEELFTLTDDEATQREFVRVRLAHLGDGRTRVVISLRADFRPAERTGLVVDADLVGAIVSEAGDRAGALPLVSHALVETWHRRVDGHLTLAAYRDAGSIAAAIARPHRTLHDRRRLDPVGPPADRGLIARPPKSRTRRATPGDARRSAGRSSAPRPLRDLPLNRLKPIDIDQLYRQLRVNGPAVTAPADDQGWSCQKAEVRPTLARRRCEASIVLGV